MTDRNKAILIIVIGSLIGGAVSSVTKIGLLQIPPFSFSFLRFFIASIFVLPFFLKAKVKFDKAFLSLIAVSILPVANISFFVVGVKSTTASIGQMLYTGSPILVGIISFLILKNKLSAKRWLFIVIGLMGVIEVILLPLLQKNSLFAGDLKGNILISIGVILYSFYMVLSKQYQKKYSPVIITAVFFFLSTIVFLILSFIEFNSTQTWYRHLSQSSIYAVLYVSIFATVGSYVLNQYVIKYSSPIIASLGFYLVPILAYFSAFILLGENLTAGLIVGTIIVFTSVGLISLTK